MEPLEPFGSIDVNITLVDAIAAAPESAPEVLQHDFDDTKSVSAVDAADGATIITFSGACRFRITAGTIEMWPFTSSDLDIAIILLQGWVMSMVLARRECLVLHASAVETERGCIALVGDSGMGKSTVTAMLIRDGADLVSDDVFRVARIADGPWLGYPGITALRLRESARELAAELSHVDLTTTVDDRLLVHRRRKRAEPMPLLAVLFPDPSRSAAKVTLDWMEAKYAAVELDQTPRVYDWKIAEPARRHFGQVVQLASDVPVGTLTIPWGPPWVAGLLENVESLVLEQYRDS
ncbi:MAG: hypothetical protein ACN4GZ_05060 [Acidimicrobiales bacterium]